MEIVCFIVGMLGGVLVGGIIGYKYVNGNMRGQLERAEKMSDKHLAIMNLLSMWLQNKEENLKIETYLAEKQIKKVAIYGMASVGERLYDELEKSNIEIAYCIDRNANNIYKDVDVVNPDDSLDSNIDAIVVTAFTFFDEIEASLKAKVNVPIISIDDIIFSL